MPIAAITAAAGLKQAQSLVEKIVAFLSVILIRYRRNATSHWSDAPQIGL